MKTIIVSGASGNLGSAIINKFSQEKENNIIGTLIPNDPVKIATEKNNVSFIELNLLDEQQCINSMHKIIETHEKIDTAVLTVGGYFHGNIEHTTSKDIHKQYQLNFETTYHLARPIFLQMLQQGFGNIFLISSKAGLSSLHSSHVVAYSLTKSLIIRLSELMNIEAKEKHKDVHTTVVIPGTLDTAQNRIHNPHDNHSNWVLPESIAEIIHYYNSDKAKPIRESVIKIYGNS